jgi:hypothetical protein
LGTPGYSAPEQKSDPQRADSRADIYSLGVVFYEMLTGELPGKLIEAPSKKVQIDVRLDEVVLRALETKPELRYQKASALKTQIETIASTCAETRPKATDSRKPVPLLRWRDRWIWDTPNVVLMAFVPGLISVLLASILVPFFGAKGLLALLPAGMGLIFASIYGLVGRRVRALMARLPASDADVAEALIFERPRETPGIALLHDNRLELFGAPIMGTFAVISHLVIPLGEIASLSEVQLFNGRKLRWKRGFVLDLKTGGEWGWPCPNHSGDGGAHD